MSEYRHNQVPAEVRAVLVRLRRRIRRYVFLEGLALVLCVLALLFWISLGIDWAYFQARNLELPRWFRAAFAVGALGLFVFTFLAWVLFRTLRSLRERALALVLERRFPELDDRLITAVESADEVSLRDSPLTAAMLRRTVEDVSRLSQRLDVGAVFEKRPLRRAVVLAAVLIVSIVAFAWTNAEALARWQRGYIALDDIYWERETELVVKVIVQPGDRVKEFRDQQYKHPRGGDLTFLVDVPQDKRPDGGDWKVPERVQLLYSLDDRRGSGSVYMSQLGDRQFRHSMANQLDGLRFWVRGGDYINRVPYRVIMVSPPQIDRLVLDCRFPEYTGLNETGLNRRLVQGTHTSLPLETEFRMDAAANKPLVHVRIEYGPLELAIDRPAEGVTPQATFTLRREDGTNHTLSLPPELAHALLSSDGRTISVPFTMTAHAASPDAAADHIRESDFGPAFVLAPDTLMRIYMEDIDEVVSTEPVRLMIGGIPDQPPHIETHLAGIGSAVTRTARIPVVGTITDDYGIAEARFEYRIDDDEQWQSRDFRSQPRRGVSEFKLQRSAEQPFEQFEVLPLDLAVGRTLTLTVYAQDGDNINGPNVSRGERYNFRIVSNEELLSMLYEKEINLRQRFEQIIREVEQTRSDLILHRGRAQEARELRTANGEPDDPDERQKELRTIRTTVESCAVRSLHQVRKNAGETAVVEAGFRDILEELVNNGIHTRQMTERLDSLIVRPLNRINTIHFPACDGAVGLFKLATEEDRDPIAQIDDSVEALSDMLELMQTVLAEMQELAQFHEAVARLEAIIEDAKEVHKRTQDASKRELIDRLRSFDLD